VKFVSTILHNLTCSGEGLVISVPKHR
jgi:hypothetical protein